ncbi:MAG: hypothetical protein K6A45_06890 [Lachnospiraceae bacterium]|nr:hypothetical protein [Lachnospiraceae bacterium]
MLKGWIEDNLSALFVQLNNNVAGVSVEVSQTPSSWNGGIFSIVQTLSETVIVPIAAVIITYVLCYELISMLIDRNNMHDFDTALFLKYIFKAGIAVFLLSKTSDIVMAMFDLGSQMTMKAGVAIYHEAGIPDIASDVIAIHARLDSMTTGELWSFVFETMFAKLIINIMSVLVTVIMYGRMIEIYLYVSCAPIPFATLGNKEWGSIGTNYIKSIFALALQGFFIMVCVGIYAALVSGLVVADDLSDAVWQLMAHTVVLCFSLFKTGSLAKAIMNAR